jgi:CHAT domain-containing protein
MKFRSLVFLFLTTRVLCCGETALQQQDQSQQVQSLQADYQKLSAMLNPAPIFVPHSSFWKFVMAPERPDQLQKQVRDLAEAAAQQHAIRLQARAMILHAQIPTTEQPAALHELRAARQMLQAISDYEGAALSELGEAYREYRAGDELSGRAHVYKALLFFSRQHSLDGQLKGLSLSHLLVMPEIQPSDLLSSDTDNSAAAAELFAILSRQANGGETEVQKALLSSDWQKQHSEVGGSATKVDDSWIMLFDAYEQYQRGQTEEAARLWGRAAQSHDSDPLLRGLSWLGLAQIGADKIKKNPEAGRKDAGGVHDALAKARQAFTSARRTGGIAQADLLGSQLDFLIHHEKDARERLQHARKLFEEMDFQPGILETELISAEGENIAGNSAGSLASLNAARKRLGTVASGAGLHGQLLRVPLDDVHHLADFCSRNSELPIEQHLSAAYACYAWASRTEDPLLKIVALRDLSNALIQGGYLNDYLYYATEKEELLQRYMQRVPLALRLQKAALLEYDFLQNSKLIESKMESFTAFNAPLLIDVYLAASKAMRPAASDLLHEDMNKEDAAFEQAAAQLRKLANECETRRQAFLAAISGDPNQAVRALGRFIASLRALFDYLDRAASQAAGHSYDETITQTISSLDKQNVRIEAGMHVLLVAFVPAHTKIEMLQESAYLDFVRDVLSAAIAGNEAIAIDAANNLASFYELYRDQMPISSEIMLPFSFLKEGGMGTLSEMEKPRIDSRKKALDQAMKQYNNIHNGFVINKVIQQYAPSSSNIDPMTFDSGNLGDSDMLQKNFEHIKERESPDQTVVTTRKEGDTLVIAIEHSHSAWFQARADSEYVRVQPSQKTVDLQGNLAVLRSAQDPYLVPANPGLSEILNALNAANVEQLMYASLTGSSLQKAVQNASTFSHIIQSGQVALSMQARNDFLSQPGGRSASEWKTFIKGSPLSSKFTSLLAGIQLSATSDTPEAAVNPAQEISEFFGKLSKVVSSMSGDRGQDSVEEGADEDSDDADTNALREVGQIPELATLVQYPSLTFLILDDRANAKKIATALQARLRKKSSSRDSASIYLGDDVTIGQRVSILTNSALFHIAIGSYKEAQADLEEAVAATGEADPGEAFQFHYLLAMCAKRSNDPDEALKELGSAVEELAHLRSSLTTRSLALALQPVRQMIYEEYMALAMEKGDGKAMLAALYQYKKSTQIPPDGLLQNLAGSDVVAQVGEITLLYDLRSRGAIQGGPDAAWVLDLLASSFNKDKPEVDPDTVALSTLNNVANVLINQIQPVRLHPHLSHEDWKYNLKKNELAIVYFAGSRGLYALTVDDKGTRHLHYVTISAEALSQLCQKFRAQIVAHTDVSSTAAELYRITLGTITELEGKTRLKIWPDGPLQIIPFQALKSRPDAKYLVQSYVISYITGASGSTRPAGDVTGEMLLVGNPDGSLPAAEDEVNSISQLPGFKSVVLKQDATLQNLQRYINAADFVHFATHARANEVQPNFAFLQLAPYDRLYSIDLAGMRFAGKQVFLSACETKLGEYIPGEDIYGISDVFLTAGAGSVVATLWRVESGSSALFAERYYAAWQAEKDGAAAVAQVARDFIEGRAYLERNGEVITLKDPIYWAGFNRMEPWSSFVAQ